MRYILSSFKGGKSEYEDRGIAGSFKMGKNLNIRGTEDCLSSTIDLTTDGNAAAIVTDLILFWVNSSDGNVYAFSDTGNIYKRTSGAVWSIVYTDSGGRITGAYEWYCENGNKYIFWATATHLHEKLIPGASNWSDVDANIVYFGTTYTYPKNDLTTSSWHTMAQADGQLMICNVDRMAMVGYDGSYTKEAVLLRPGITTQTLIEYGSQVLIGGGDGVRESWLETWQYSALSWIAKNRIPAKTINAIVQAELLLMNCGDNLLFFSDMTNNLPVLTMDGKCNPGGVVEQGGLALFGLFGGSYPGIWSYGRVRKNEAYTLNLEQYLDCDEIGSLNKIGEVVFLSFRKGAVYGIRKVGTNKATAEYYSLDLSSPAEANWESVELVTETIPTGCSIAVYYDLDSTGSWTQAKMVGDVATATAGMRDPIFLIGSYGRTINLKLVLTPSTTYSPNVSKITINFD